jgi:hypothetical protein
LANNLALLMTLDGRACAFELTRTPDQEDRNGFLLHVAREGELSPGCNGKQLLDMTSVHGNHANNANDVI